VVTRASRSICSSCLLSPTGSFFNLQFYPGCRLLQYFLFMPLAYLREGGFLTGLPVSRLLVVCRFLFPYSLPTSGVGFDFL
jgi:hypothetical protein